MTFDTYTDKIFEKTTSVLLPKNKPKLQCSENKLSNNISSADFYSSTAPVPLKLYTDSNPCNVTQQLAIVALPCPTSASTLHEPNVGQYPPGENALFMQRAAFDVTPMIHENHINSYIEYTNGLVYSPCKYRNNIVGQDLDNNIVGQDLDNNIVGQDLVNNIVGQDLVNNIVGQDLDNNIDFVNCLINNECKMPKSCSLKNIPSTISSWNTSLKLDVPSFSVQNTTSGIKPLHNSMNHIENVCLNTNTLDEALSEYQSCSNTQEQKDARDILEKMAPATAAAVLALALAQHEVSNKDRVTKNKNISTLAVPICWCPCISCNTCPFRNSVIINHKGSCEKTAVSLISEDGTNNDNSTGYNASRIIETDFSPLKSHRNKKSNINCNILNIMKTILHLEAKDNPTKYVYDSKILPDIPLPKCTQKILAITELPFLILWVYFTYCIVIVSMTGKSAPSTVWLSAIVASLLVGTGLNANAYKSVMVPRRRGSVRHHRHVRALMELRKYGQNIDHVEMIVDWGMVIRFFLIPFGVSCLSGLTNSNRDKFLLVFPLDPFYFSIGILFPTLVVCVLLVLRILVLWKMKVRWSLKVLLFNGALVD